MGLGVATFRVGYLAMILNSLPQKVSISIA